MAFDALLKLTRRYSLRVRGVLHIGGHIGEEAETYDALGIKRQFWVEPQPHVFDRLVAATRHNPAAQHAHVACGPVRGVMSLNVIPRGDENHGMSSFLKPTAQVLEAEGAYLLESIEVPVIPLDDLVLERDLKPDEYNLLVMDTQGFELEILKGAQSTLAHIDYVYTEVSRTPLYEGSCVESEIDEFLGPFGLIRVYSRIGHNGHGDALYMRRGRIPLRHSLRVRLLGPKVRVSRKRS